MDDQRLCEIVHTALGGYHTGETMRVARAIRDEFKSALNALRIEAAYCQEHEFPMFGSDVLRIMNGLGLCSQEEADAAIAAAKVRMAHEEIANAFPVDVEGQPIQHRETDTPCPISHP